MQTKHQLQIWFKSADMTWVIAFYLAAFWMHIFPFFFILLLKSQSALSLYSSEIGSEVIKQPVKDKQLDSIVTADQYLLATTRNTVKNNILQKKCLADCDAFSENKPLHFGN